MKKIKIGAKVKLSNGEEYIVTKFLRIREKYYMYCSTVKGEIKPVVFEYKIENNKLLVKMEDDIRLIKKISKKIKEKI